MAGIYKKVWAVIRVLDECSGKPVEHGCVKLTVPMGIEAVSKGDGIFLIIRTAREEKETLVPDEGCRVKYSLSGPMYETFERELEIKGNNQNYSIISVSMVPSVLMPPRKGMTVIEGSAEPGSKVYAACIDEKKMLKITGSSEDTQRIQVYRQDRKKLDGRYVAVIADNKITDMTVIEKDEEDGTLVLSKPFLLKDGKKDIREIYILHRAVAGDSGYFRIMIPGLASTGCDCIVKSESPESKEKDTVTQITRGERNKIVI